MVAIVTSLRAVGPINRSSIPDRAQKVFFTSELPGRMSSASNLLLKGFFFEGETAMLWQLIRMIGAIPQPLLYAFMACTGRPLILLQYRK
jgi:hypothetical protein